MPPKFLFAGVWRFCVLLSKGRRWSDSSRYPYEFSLAACEVEFPKVRWRSCSWIWERDFKIYLDSIKLDEINRVDSRNLPHYYASQRPLCARRKKAAQKIVPAVNSVTLLVTSANFRTCSSRQRSRNCTSFHRLLSGLSRWVFVTQQSSMHRLAFCRSASSFGDIVYVLHVWRPCVLDKTDWHVILYCCIFDYKYFDHRSGL